MAKNNLTVDVPIDDDFQEEETNVHAMSYDNGHSEVEAQEIWVETKRVLGIDNNGKPIIETVKSMKKVRGASASQLKYNADKIHHHKDDSIDSDDGLELEPHEAKHHKYHIDRERIDSLKQTMALNVASRPQSEDYAKVNDVLLDTFSAREIKKLIEAEIAKTKNVTAKLGDASVNADNKKEVEL